MLRMIGTCVVVAVGCLIVHADEPARSAAVKKVAQELGDATLKGDYGTLIDHTYEGIVKLMGGREKAIEVVETTMKQLKTKGIAISGYRANDPGEFLTEGGNTFVVVPTRLEMTIPGGKAVAKSYLLGISSDEGKTWGFVDGAGMGNKNFRDKGLPKLPAKLKLPEPEEPEITKDK